MLEHFAEIGDRAFDKAKDSFPLLEEQIKQLNMGSRSDRWQVSIRTDWERFGQRWQGPTKNDGKLDTQAEYALFTLKYPRVVLISSN